MNDSETRVKGDKIDREKMLGILKAKAAVAGICYHMERENAFLELMEIVERIPAAE